jgi:hypothetical protein
VPWRFSFDRRTGDLVIGDVGEHRFEELDFVRRSRLAGANFGWPLFEGRRRMRPGSPEGLVSPVLARRHLLPVWACESRGRKSQAGVGSARTAVVHGRH